MKIFCPGREMRCRLQLWAGHREVIRQLSEGKPVGF